MATAEKGFEGSPDFTGFVKDKVYETTRDELEKRLPKDSINTASHKWTRYIENRLKEEHNRELRPWVKSYIDTTSKIGDIFSSIVNPFAKKAPYLPDNAIGRGAAAMAEVNEVNPNMLTRFHYWLIASRLYRPILTRPIGALK